MIGRRRFARDRQGRFRPGLDPAERDLLKALPSEAELLLDSGDESTRRVFPVAYLHDDKADAEYHEMMGANLLARHKSALETFAATIDAPSVGEEQLRQWLDALEVMRLVLGTQLDVSEDATAIRDGDPRAAEFAVYQYLSMLQGEIIDALAEILPHGHGEAGET